MTQTSQVYPWIKLYTAMLDEPKLARMSEGACWRYVQLMLLAGRAAAGGALAFGDEPATVADIAWTLRIDTDKLRSQLDELTRAGLVALEGGAYVLTRFLDEQGPGEGAKREQERAKWRKWQARHRAKVTGAQEAESDSEPESEEELEQELELESQADVSLTLEGEQELNKPVGLHRQGSGNAATIPTLDAVLVELRKNAIQPNSERAQDAIDAWRIDFDTQTTENGKQWFPGGEWVMSAVLEKYDMLTQKAMGARIERTRSDVLNKLEQLKQEAQQHAN